MYRNLTLFPDNVDPVMSSRLIEIWKEAGVPGNFHACIGVFAWHNCNITFININYVLLEIMYSDLYFIIGKLITCENYKNIKSTEIL